MYKSQWVYHELINRMMGLNSYHGIHANDADYAEAFYLMPIKKYIKKDNK